MFYDSGVLPCARVTGRSYFAQAVVGRRSQCQSIPRHTGSPVVFIRYKPITTPMFKPPSPLCRSPRVRYPPHRVEWYRAPPPWLGYDTGQIAMKTKRAVTDTTTDDVLKRRSLLTPRCLRKKRRKHMLAAPVLAGAGMINEMTVTIDTNATMSTSHHCHHRLLHRRLEEGEAEVAELLWKVVVVGVRRRKGRAHGTNITAVLHAFPLGRIALLPNKV